MSNTANFNSAAVWNSTNGIVTTVGSNGGTSAYGTYDQNGNVSEIITINHSLFEQNIVYRGGGFDSSLINLDKVTRYVDIVGREFNSLGFRLAASGTLDASGWALIQDINNSGDSINSNYGTVSYEYWISKYEVTNCEYAEFLNAVAKTDRYGLYNPSMGSSVYGGILRGGSSGSYFYYTKTNMHNKPVVFVSWYDAARYANWLHNDKPTGYQDNTTTENGAYYLNGICGGYTVPKQPQAKFYVPDENEWYKAAYYSQALNDGSGGYYQYATQSNYDDEPVEIAAYGNGDGYFASPSLYDTWNSSCPTIATTTTTTTTTAEPTTTTTTTTTTAAPVLDKCHNKQFSAIQIRRDTDANFANYNPILASGEPAYAIDTRIFKIGDGVTDWNNLISPSQAPLGDLSTLSIINDPCDTEYILIQNAGRLTQVISINNIIKAISTIDGGNVIYTGC
jgi:hypothetical protein